MTSNKRSGCELDFCMEGDERQFFPADTDSTDGVLYAPVRFGNLTITESQEKRMNEMTQTAPAENKMGTMSEGKLLINMSLPMMISMLVQALYNIVDSVFVSRISEDALTAVSLAFPLQSLMIALGAGTGVGVNALISRALGQKNPKEADKVAINGVFVYIISYVVVALLGLVIVKPYFGMQTDAGQEAIMNYGVTYLSICLTFSFGIFGQFIFERILQATGRTLFTMISQGVGAIVNLILDPILIFGLFGAPRLEIAGAAIATVIGQIVAAIIAFIWNMWKNTDVHISFRGFRPDVRIIGSIYQIGIPSICYAVHRFRDDDGDEFNLYEGGFQFYRGGGFWRLFQTAELLLYAGLRTEQRIDSDCFL